MLDPDTVEQIKELAKKLNLSFSRTAETLLLQGLPGNELASQALLTRLMVEKAVGHSFDRFAKLIVIAAIQAGAAREAAEYLLTFHSIEALSALIREREQNGKTGIPDTDALDEYMSKPLPGVSTSRYIHSSNG